MMHIKKFGIQFLVGRSVNKEYGVNFEKHFYIRSKYWKTNSIHDVL